MSDWQEEAKARRLKLNGLLDALGLSITATFVPWSKSRNYRHNTHAKDRNLNWQVSLMQQRSPDAKPLIVLTIDYQAGIGHCPWMKVQRSGIRWNIENTDAVAWECEHGKAYSEILRGARASAKPLMPDTLDVIHCLILDSNAIEYGGFEDWAETFGYETDSRKAEAIYRACLETGLKLRKALGDKALAELREAFQDY